MRPILKLERSPLQPETIWYVRDVTNQNQMRMSGGFVDALRYAHSVACEASLQIDATVRIEVEGQGTFAIRMRKVD